MVIVCVCVHVVYVLSKVLFNPPTKVQVPIDFNLILFCAQLMSIVKSPSLYIKGKIKACDLAGIQTQLLQTLVQALVEFFYQLSYQNFFVVVGGVRQYYFSVCVCVCVFFLF